jgi:hypothetical protein
VLVACSSASKPPTLVNTTAPDPASPPAVVVQLLYRGTFMIGPPFSQAPPFTLLADGTVITSVDDAPLVTAKLSHDEVERILRRVRELGFERLESHVESCQHTGKGTSICISDAAFTILRVALPSGKVREVTTYADFSNEPAIHQKIVDYLSSYKPTSATPYRATFGVLHVAVHPASKRPASTASCPAIDAAIVHLEPGRTTGALQIDGPALASVLALARGNRRSFIACAEGVSYDLTFVPGVPGTDLSSELEPYRSRK